MIASQKPYFIRAVFEWCNDENLTPYLLTLVDENTIVPQQYVKDGQIVLNIAFAATKDLLIGNEWITFKATFSGSIMEVSIPIYNVLAIFAKETGQGINFPPPQDKDKPTKPKVSGGLKLVK